jgi:DNA-binding beta-propeller fold protein YncE
LAYCWEARNALLRVSDNSTQDVTAAATWTSSAVGVASISNAPGSIGLVTAAVEYAYVLNSLAGTISEFNVGSGGALSAMNFITTGNNPQGIAIDPTSRYVYVANTNDNTLSEYAVGAGGVLASIGTVATGLSPSAIAIGRLVQECLRLNLTGRCQHLRDNGAS